MQESEIMQTIELGITNYNLWTIGITDDPTRRKAEHESEGKVMGWRDWKADTETIARNVERYFLAKGMKGGTGGGEHPTYVYIFL
jgi:hypothetical protein